MKKDKTIYFLNIGDKVEKKSGKPFKSGLKIVTIKEFTKNSVTEAYAATFIEDNSIVNYELLKLSI